MDEQVCAEKQIKWINEKLTRHDIWLKDHEREN